ncbi:MAG: glucose-6-phosphate isomerase [Alphaproteobacteria bacterium]
MTDILKQDISGCFPASVGLNQAGLAALLHQCEAARRRIAGELEAGQLAPLAIARGVDDLSVLQPIADDWRQRFKRVVLIGIGGSSLGARALAVLAADPDLKLPSLELPSLELVVPDNLDADLIASVLRTDDLAHTGFLLVSKSGGTVEPLAQAIAAVSAVRAHLGGAATARHFLAITEQGDGALRRLASRINAPVLDHDPDIGGRFSVLSLVGMLPAMMLGLDAGAVRAGAGEVLEQAMATTNSSPAMGAAVQVALQRLGLGQSVLLSYGEAFQPFALWYRQMWAESLGKQGQGTTPIAALGPVDQHSQLQLYLQGPLDKFFTVLTVRQAGCGPTVDANLAEDLGLDYMAGRTIGDLVGAMQSATADTLIKHGRPLRRLSAERLDERTLGALFMHFMLETLFAADLMDVDPFGQPAVEESKILARQYLRDSAS